MTDSGLVEALAAQERAWVERPLVRRLYHDWFALVAAALSPARPTIELGAGIGRFREVVPDAVATDVESTPWATSVVEAHALPYDAASVGNLVLIDVFHHLADPARFLDEAARVLTPGGRLVILDPYCSPVSTVAYRAAHHEKVDLSGSPFDLDEAVARDPLEANQARATLAFFRHEREREVRWPSLTVVDRRRLALLVYPLSGGFTKRRLLPRALWKPALAAERLMAPLAPVMAFRCLIVLQRT